MFDLSNPQHRDLLASRIKNDIDDYCVKTYHEGHRKHLGASIMGEACDRMLWYSFRWVKEKKEIGRMYRLFNVGHSAEPRFISYLRGIGFEVHEFDPNTGKQFRISGHNGHYGGSLDGMCKAPERYELSENLIFLNEFKTNGTGAGFTNVGAQPLHKSKPKHWAQVCQYGYHKNIKYVLYLIENKNDSDLTVKIEELDWKYGQQLSMRALDIINATKPPARIAENPAFFDCKFCNFIEICHQNAQYDKNCRSCKFSMPTENKTWACSKFNSVIPEEFIIKGCENYEQID